MFDCTVNIASVENQANLSTVITAYMSYSRSIVIDWFLALLLHISSCAPSFALYSASIVLTHFHCTSSNVMVWPNIKTIAKRSVYRINIRVHMKRHSGLWCFYAVGGLAVACCHPSISHIGRELTPTLTDGISNSSLGSAQDKEAAPIWLNVQALLSLGAGVGAGAYHILFGHLPTRSEPSPKIQSRVA